MGIRGDRAVWGYGRRIVAGAVALAAIGGFASAHAETAKNVEAADYDSNAVMTRLDASFLRRGLNSPAPSYKDSLLGDYAGFRSALADYGFGFQVDDTETLSYNLLDVARRGPGPLLGPGLKRSTQQYGGQRPTYVHTTLMYLLYDLTQWGVPDGQLLVGSAMSWASWQPQGPSKVGLFGLSWYQTAFDKRLEIKVGYIANNSEWIGTSIGGSYASPLGGSSSIQYAMGLTTAGVQPTARVTWHITDNLYEQLGVMRSYPIGGPTGSTMMDNEHFNPTGFNITMPNGKLLVMNEVGYKSPAAPGEPFLWLRAGLMHNESRYTNHKVGGINSGIDSGYFLGDLQLLQFDPETASSARRGLYGGFSAMFGPAQNLGIYKYFEGRFYVTGPFASRADDQVAFVYSYNAVNKYSRNAINLNTATTGLFANAYAASYLMTYTYRVVPGMYLTGGLSYAGNPSVVRTPGEGHALNGQLTLFFHL
jgi:porin